MGRVEVQDQVAGLQHAAAEVGYIDLARVAVAGWSYGEELQLGTHCVIAFLCVEPEDTIK